MGNSAIQLSQSCGKFITYHRDAHTNPAGPSLQCRTVGTSTMPNIVTSVIDAVVSLEQIGGSVLRVNAGRMKMAREQLPQNTS